MLSCLLLLTETTLFAAKSVNRVELNDVRLWSQKHRSYIGFKLSKQPLYQVFHLHQPEKLVIDFHNTQANTSFSRLKHSPYVEQVRYTVQKNKTLRVVFDLNQPVQVATHWQQHRGRLQLTLSAKAIQPSIDQPLLWRLARVVIDPGHGGHDPGAVGKNKIYEKHITLSVAKQLMTYLNRLPGVEASLTRNTDQFLGLRQRLAKSRQMQADLFISLHADHFKNSRAKGGSVFILSKEGASSEAAKLLAERENAALIGSLPLKKTKKHVAEVLLDLSQNATLKQSRQLANVVLNKLKKFIPLHYKTIQRADFAVLKAPDVPSLLVELGFISHPDEAKQLMQTNYQKRLVRALATGVIGYLEQYPPQQTWFAHRHRYHQVISGESLSKIALKFNSSLSALRKANHLSSDHIRIGQKLLVPIEKSIG
ncbi:N-acetylmuramoyl-L-alanine amidase [Piscirickettsia salmonis]|nr:N-acetylmuramoyl-L-alanine amidase [Piscirickettsia salmonis LF-89 = ATCC VR-1361]AMA42085.1 N-acetylmuramoyl-L-alanine amidase [Piscirickettsia salmonis]AOS34559.1 N-acetylmuramoyl-L-alanine amidase [Piscirickettsia salmonis]APS59278.1 N-acetylmuramoyl-L-alanine amidase [Piscirickettsia salmonis]APS62504.1 N-acetylmuramoyl-L-alanine amidase [Piscirickettsia salmonis]